MYNGVTLGSALACLLRAYAVREERLPWLVMGIGLLAWTGGDLYWTFVLTDDPAPPTRPPATRSTSPSTPRATRPWCCWRARASPAFAAASGSTVPSRRWRSVPLRPRWPFRPSSTRPAGTSPRWPRTWPTRWATWCCSDSCSCSGEPRAGGPTACGSCSARDSRSPRSAMCSIWSRPPTGPTPRARSSTWPGPRRPCSWPWPPGSRRGTGLRPSLEGLAGGRRSRSCAGWRPMRCLWPITSPTSTWWPCCSPLPASCW